MNLTKKEMEEKATEFGKRAFLLKMTVRDNPFVKNGLYWLCWKDGFITAQEKAKEEKAALKGEKDGI